MFKGLIINNSVYIYIGLKQLTIAVFLFRLYRYLDSLLITAIGDGYMVFIAFYCENVSNMQERSPVLI